MKSINVYLNFNGDCEEAFNFYQSVFGGDFAILMRFEEMPPSEDFKVADKDKKNIMHVSLQIKEGLVLMGSDTPTGMPSQLGTNISISIAAESEQEVDELFDKLAESGEVTMPKGKMFWGAYFGSCRDKFGVNWMVDCELSGN